MKNPKYVTWNNQRYSRVPTSKHRNHRVYYYTTTEPRTALHRDVWESVHGKIPEGHHIHHKDENPFNNDLSNLECLSQSEHSRLHCPLAKYVKDNPDHQERIVELAKAWHASEEGSKWHSQNSIKQWRNKKPKTFTCKVCKKSFKSKNPRNPIYCSNVCGNYARWHSGNSQEQRNCQKCNQSFDVYKYSKRLNCFECKKEVKRR